MPPPTIQPELDWLPPTPDDAAKVSRKRLTPPRLTDGDCETSKLSDRSLSIDPLPASVNDPLPVSIVALYVIALVNFASYDVAPAAQEPVFDATIVMSLEPVTIVVPDAIVKSAWTLSTGPV